MESPPTWERIAVAVLAVLLVVFLWPGMKAALARSREAERDWGALLLPLGLVVLLVLFLIALNR